MEDNKLEKEVEEIDRQIREMERQIDELQRRRTDIHDKSYQSLSKWIKKYNELEGSFFKCGCHDHIAVIEKAAIERGSFNTLHKVVFNITYIVPNNQNMTYTEEYDILTSKAVKRGNRSVLFINKHREYNLRDYKTPEGLMSDVDDWFRYEEFEKMTDNERNETIIGWVCGMVGTNDKKYDIPWQLK